ncbi:MAG TPA: sigma 54-interacting transcriptional regulator [Syntrophales bacterium]|nr:sigma 54-interacting transcriptional regulator [Syntrophales bacterium]HOX94767.1 sigma 54-interacting transcriptional regulator [Syntrophales bacterium]HPI56957.1 sigma 54-interacting transcriptional regulator [Syntrophales bacterium]HPN23543.1 sigma 54-interacting transcriptional regulator [Syntrophales bacterium]HQM27932.1 sigma 54-interacting transcriptional regulator [Syntrophales bacterium]
MAVILVVDDEPLQRDILQTILTDAGYEALTASSGEEALKLAKTYSPDVVLTDLKMKRMDGIELLERLMAREEPPTVLIMTAFGTIDSAVDAMKKGAFDYMTKPLDRDVVIMTVRRALERTELLRKNLELQQALMDKFKIEGIVGKSKAVQDVIRVIKKVSNSSATVLILGESGTGKELIARAIHFNSPRAAKSFTAINCAAIPETLLESELFGYEPGAFTGATSRKIGLFEATNGGTILLDEVGDLPPLTQSKILRVLQEREVRRLGGRDSIKVDVRIIAATNRDLERLMQDNTFREDLFYRLKVVTIELPPLRERREDILDLAQFFLQKFNHEFKKNVRRIDEQASKALADFQWPGNIRQLQSVIEKAVLMCDTETISLQDIRDELTGGPQHKGILDLELPDEGLSFEALEKAVLKKAMKKADHVVARAARLLGMTYKTFWYRWEKFNLDAPPADNPEAPVLDFDIPDGGIDFEDLEKAMIKKAMAKTNNVVSKASRLLGMSEKALRSRWEKYGLKQS